LNRAADAESLNSAAKTTIKGQRRGGLTGNSPEIMREKLSSWSKRAPRTGLGQAVGFTRMELLALIALLAVVPGMLLPNHTPCN
jgi:hypothetical protein